MYKIGSQQGGRTVRLGQLLPGKQGDQLTGRDGGVLRDQPGQQGQLPYQLPGGPAALECAQLLVPVPLGQAAAIGSQQERTMGELRRFQPCLLYTSPSPRD